MPERNWRSLRWSQFSGSEKFWFIVMCVALALILIAAGVDGAGVIAVPEFAVLVLAAVDVYAAYRTVTDLGMFIEDDEPDDEDESEDDGENAH